MLIRRIFVQFGLVNQRSITVNLTVLTPYQVEKRAYWIQHILELINSFKEDSSIIEQEMSAEIASEGLEALLGHLRLCASIPERYRHDSTEEKLYSKYTDIVIHRAYSALGLTSLILKTRGDSADVECATEHYSFVADAKAFRLSRTAKNQKDFKIAAMKQWKRGKPYAMVVCPSYQLPSQSSQIYEQSSSNSVLISTYSHLAVLVRYAQDKNQTEAIALLHELFKTVDAMNPSKNASDYWQAINRNMLNFSPDLRALWLEEKQASSESIFIAQQEALDFLAKERSRILQLSREAAINEILQSSKLEQKIKTISIVTDNGILDLG